VVLVERGPRLGSGLREGLREDDRLGNRRLQLGNAGRDVAISHVDFMCLCTCMVKDEKAEVKKLFFLTVKWSILLKGT
jgi:hypothetical protein